MAAALFRAFPFVAVYYLPAPTHFLVAAAWDEATHTVGAKVDHTNAANSLLNETHYCDIRRWKLSKTSNLPCLHILVTLNTCQFLHHFHNYPFRLPLGLTSEEN